MDRFKSFGRRLVLTGEVKDIKGERAFANIGLEISKAKGPQEQIVFHPNGKKVEVGNEVKLRVMYLETKQGRVTSIEVEMATNASDRLLVQGSDGFLQPSPERLLRNDSVMLYRPGYVEQGEDEYKVLGFEGYKVSWTRDDGDIFQLNHRDQRDLILERHLLKDENSTIWMTVEWCDNHSKEVRLSRRLQMERALPEPNSICRARVRGMVGKSRVLVSIFGCPWMIPLAELASGTIHGTEIVKNMAEASNGLGCEIELLCKNDGGLSAVDAYREPKALENEAVVAVTSGEGIIATSRGFSLFVPKRNLVWCNLNAEDMQRIFPRGTRLQIRKSRNANRKVSQYSLLNSNDAKKEIDSLIASDEPVFARTLLSADGSRTLVRTQSGILLEMDEQLKPKSDVHVYAKDVNISSQLIVASKTRPKRSKWNFPGGEHWSLPRVYPSVVSKAYDELAKVRQPADLSQWINNNQHLDTSTRTIRILLDGLTYSGITNSEYCGALADSDNECEVLELLGGIFEGDVNNAMSSFASGYRAIDSQDFDEAVEYLKTASNDGPFDFDTEFSLAHALAGKNDLDAMNQKLRWLLQLLWSNSINALGLPIQVSAPTAANDGIEALESAQQWVSAVTSGDLGLCKRLLSEISGLNQTSLWYQSQKIIHSVCEGRFGRLFESNVDQYLLTIRCDDDNSHPIDPQFRLIAAWLEFRQGKLKEGWRQLEKTRDFDDQRLEPTAIFWRDWLAGRPVSESASELLVELWDLYQKVKWNDLRANELERAWKLFRNSRNLWELEPNACQILPAEFDPQDLAMQFGFTEAELACVDSSL